MSSRASKDYIARGVIRRIAVAPNHFKLGMTANGMTVWDIEDDAVSEIGRRVGALDFVSPLLSAATCLAGPGRTICLRWCMARAARKSKASAPRSGRCSVDAKCHGSDILYSKRILKKTGLRLSRNGG